MIVVVDYGMGNLRSVSKALESVGAKTKVTSKPEDIISASAIVVPGVGAFRRGMDNLRKYGLSSVIIESINKNKPFLGICLGLQLLFTESEEHGICKGLNIIEGNVRKFSTQVKIPHMGWNQIKVKTTTLFDGIPDNSYFYFDHSYYVEPKDKNTVIATTEYGENFASAVNKDNVWGVQFHPEKSSTLGLKILKNFAELTR